MATDVPAGTGESASVRATRLGKAVALVGVDVNAGSIPPALGKCAAINKLWLHNNALSGESRPLAWCTRGYGAIFLALALARGKESMCWLSRVLCAL